MKNDLILSELGHTWIFDLDGTILKHNGYLIDGVDSFIPFAKDFLNSLPEKDMIIFITSRKEEYKDITENFLREHGIRYTHIIFEAPFGERILVNDMKPSGLKTAYGINQTRDKWENINIIECNYI